MGFEKTAKMSVFFFFLCFLTVTYVSSEDAVTTFTITGKEAGLAVDASHEYILEGKEEEEGKIEQQWGFLKTENGNYLIECQKNKSEVLVIQGDVKKGANIIRYEKNGKLRQEWTFPKDGRIMNAEYKKWAITQDESKLYIDQASNDNKNQVFFIRPS